MEKHEDFGLLDEKGRRIGYQIRILRDYHGDAYALTSITRDGKRFGPANTRICGAGLRDTLAKAEKRMRAAKARAARLYAAADEHTWSNAQTRSGNACLGTWTGDGSTQYSMHCDIRADRVAFEPSTNILVTDEGDRFSVVDMKVRSDRSPHLTDRVTLYMNVDQACELRDKLIEALRDE